jgi:diadenosine tetraphosphate (Ap4A) HIT family hydrolase
VPETPEQLFDRAKDALRMPPLVEWQSWPFEGELRPKELLPPAPHDRPRGGEGGVGCWTCERGDEEAIWSDERWLVTRPPAPTGLPCIVFLQPRVHCDIDSLPPAEAAELGPLMVRLEAAIRAIGDIGRVHICRWGDGSEHLHWWFMARPARLPQIVGTFCAIWDDVLPPMPDELWRENLAIVARELERG